MGWNIFPACASVNPLCRPALRFIINSAAHNALVFFHVTLTLPEQLVLLRG